MTLALQFCVQAYADELATDSAQVPVLWPKALNPSEPEPLLTFIGETLSSHVQPLPPETVMPTLPDHDDGVVPTPTVNDSVDVLGQPVCALQTVTLCA